MNARHLAASFLVVTLVVAPLSAGDWTRFRGPNGTGVVDDPAIPAVPTEADVAWQTELPGIGHSSPVIWGDKVFVTSATDEPAQRIVLCLNVADGKILWERRFDSAVHKKHLLNSFASPTPAVDKTTSTSRGRCPRA
jgi:outer membrane protein assembly factor BamB